MTTTQIYWNKQAKCCMTRLWWLEKSEYHSNGVQRMGEIKTDQKTAKNWLASHGGKGNDQ